jgi:hypothetical protein
VVSQPDTTFDIGNFNDANLGNFLSRPIRIAKYTWDVGTEFKDQLEPWHLFFTDPAIKKRVDNFARVRCTLKVKVMINATPFHYGRVLTSYNPWPTKDTTHAPVIGSNEHVVLYSQRPHILLDPAENMGGELSLPFFHPNNWIETLSAGNYSDMGRIDFTSIGLLQHASAGTESISITVFAWAEDVKMCVPTTSLSAQAGRGKKKSKVGGKKTQNKSSPGMQKNDEYGQGIISKPATAVAAFAGHLESVPYVAPFAMATKMAANAVSGIARLFGYSRPAILSEAKFYKPQYATSLATCDSDETVSKLTVDSKQEICVDPRTVGLSGMDEMTIQYIASRESFLTSFPWTTVDPPDQLLFTTEVAPMLEFTKSANLYYPTALSFATWPFESWSGTLKFRFQVVCSKFHHGRLQFTYEPHNIGLDTLGAFNTVYTEIVDIGEENDFELEVAWASDVPYKSTAWSKAGVHYAPGATGNAINSTQFSNGIITVRVLNDLTAPVDAADISVNVYVSAGEDFELMNPTNATIQDTVYSHALVPQSGTGTLPVIQEDESNPVQVHTDHFVGSADVSTANRKPEIFYGESIKSFRSLLRRYNKYRTWGYDATTTSSDDARVFTIHSGYKPLMRGNMTTGIDVDGVGNKVNYVSPSLLSYLMPAYGGYRGSMRAKYRDRTNLALHIDVTRLNDHGSLRNTTNTYTIVRNNDTPSATAWRGTSDSDAMPGGIIVPTSHAPYVEVELPFYTGKRFAFSRNVGEDDAYDNTSLLITDIKATFPGSTVVGKRSAIDEYRSVGEDFNLFFFLNAPERFEQVDPAP